MQQIKLWLLDTKLVN